MNLRPNRHRLSHLGKPGRRATAALLTLIAAAAATTALGQTSATEPVATSQPATPAQPMASAPPAAATEPAMTNAATATPPTAATQQSAAATQSAGVTDQPATPTPPAAATTEQSPAAAPSASTEPTAATQPANQSAGGNTAPPPGAITAMPPSTQSTELTTAATRPATTAVASTRPFGGPIAAGGHNGAWRHAATAPATAPAGPPLAPAPYSTDPNQQQADAALAQQLSAIAEASLPTKVSDNAQWDPVWKQLAAMMNASVKLTTVLFGPNDPRPTDARLARLTVDAMQRSSDASGLLDALYAAHAADPADQFTTLRIVDYYAAKMETAQERLTYFKKLLGTVQQPGAIRAYAGVQAARLLYDRGESEVAGKTLAEALRLDADDPAGLRLRYQMLPADATPYQRATALMAMLRSNPAQPSYTAALADQLAQAGLAAESVPWYRLTISLTTFARNTDLNAARNVIVEMLLADQAPDARNLVDKLTAVQPDVAANWFLKLSVLQGNASPEDVATALQQARNAVTNTLVERVDALLPTDSDKPTTRPITDSAPYPTPDLALAVAQLNQTGKATDKAQFVQACSDLAMLELLFAQQPANAAKPIEAMAGILPPDSPQLALVQGWSALESGQPDDARTRLTPLAKQDPLAELGLIKLMGPQQRDQAAAAGRQLLSAHPFGTIAAVLAEQLRTLDVHLVLTQPEQSLAAAADAFPTNWLRVLEQPQMFYAIHVEPLYVACDYGQPMLARLTIENLSTNNLTLGPDGVLSRGLLLGAQVRADQDRSFPDAAYDEIAGPLVLAAGQASSQTVRVDQFALQQYLNANPDQATEVYATAETNPMPGPDGKVVPGPCGYQVQFLKIFSRIGEPAGSFGFNRALTDLEPGSSATPRQKISDLQLLARQFQLASAQSDQAQTAAVAREHLHMGRNDTLASVSAWAAYLSAIVADPGQRGDLLRDMAASPDWRHRELALVGAAALDPAHQKAIAEHLATDPEPCVRSLAEARLAYMKVAKGR